MNASTVFPISIVNQTLSPQVYCYIVGLSPAYNGQLAFISADGKTPYLPPNPVNTVTPLQQDCGILLGAPGESRTVYTPLLDSARIYFAVNSKLFFFTNPGQNGPSCVQPSPTNQSDPNYNSLWSFAEFTLNTDVLYMNISLVDFVAMPISATLKTATGRIDHVSGMPLNGVKNMIKDLQVQARKDGQPWDKLVQRAADGRFLRILSPQQATVLNSSLFATYFDPYTELVWQRYAAQPLTVDTQAAWGVIKGTVSGSLWNINGVCFQKPTTQDIFSCSSGPFATDNNAQRNCIIPRLAAAFNRSTLLRNNVTPDDQGPANFYQDPITNHYSRIVHEQHLDGRGYAFPYDDVVASGGSDQSGSVYDGQPQALTIRVGGNGAYVSPDAPGLAELYNI